VVAAAAAVVVIVAAEVVEIEIEDPAQAVQETDVIKIKIFLILISPDIPGFVIYNCRR
jgi:hypothetical protein